MTPHEYLSLEWGDYIDKHAAIVARELGYGMDIAEACVRINILRGHTPDDLADKIIDNTLLEAWKWSLPPFNERPFDEALLRRLMRLQRDAVSA